jgi:hypothetical protein
MCMLLEVFRVGGGACPRVGASPFVARNHFQALGRGVVADAFCALCAFFSVFCADRAGQICRPARDGHVIQQ